MSRFDKTVDNILKTITEQNVEGNQYPEDIINRSLSNLKKIKGESGDAYRIECQKRYESGQEYVKRFIDQVKHLENLNESFLDDASEAWDLTKTKAKEIKDFVLPKIANTQEFLADLAVENVGGLANSFLGEDIVKEIDSLSDSFLYKVAAIFLDPTGVMSWPYLARANELYEQNKGTEDEDIYQLNLLAAQFSVIPGLRIPLGILTLPFRLLFGAGGAVASKIFGVVGARRVARGLSSVIKKPFMRNPNVSKFTNTLNSAKSGSLSVASKAKGVGAIKNLTKTASLANKTGASKKVVDILKKGSKAAVETGKKGGGILGKTSKVATVAAAGNIPKFLEDLQSRGEKVAKTAGSKVGTLGRFPRFGEISTQRP